MPCDPDIHHRRSIRLPEYDYSCEGFYFVTICVHERRPLFGHIVDGIMHLNDAGRMVEEEYMHLPDKYPNIVCHNHVVMPNHFHAIIQIIGENNVLPPVGAGFTCPNTITVGAGSARPMNINNDLGRQTLPLQCNAFRPTLGQIMGYFKYQTSKRINLSTRLWQRNYYEHIIRNQRSFDEIMMYIHDNPIHWADDTLYVP